MIQTLSAAVLDGGVLSAQLDWQPAFLKSYFRTILRFCACRGRQIMLKT
jgi:hypothetical protein